MSRHPPISVVVAPTNLGLKPTGVDLLGNALIDAGLLTKLPATLAASVPSLPYDPIRDDHDTHLLNPAGIRDFALAQAEEVGKVLDRGEFPLVLGGDDSVLFGNLLALKRRGRYGLVFLDAHIDYYLAEESPTGEASDCDLSLAVGRGPEILSNLDGLGPLIREGDVAAIGSRDPNEAEVKGVLDSGPALVLDLSQVWELGPKKVAEMAVDHILQSETHGFWIHLDADVLDDAVNPAVDYRVPGGMGVEETGDLIATLMATEKAVGADVTILNPSLDPTHSARLSLLEVLLRGFRS